MKTKGVNVREGEGMKRLKQQKKLIIVLREENLRNFNLKGIKNVEDNAREEERDWNKKGGGKEEERQKQEMEKGKTKRMLFQSILRTLKRGGEEEVTRHLNIESPFQK